MVTASTVERAARSSTTKRALSPAAPVGSSTLADAQRPVGNAKVALAVCPAPTGIVDSAATRVEVLASGESWRLRCRRANTGAGPALRTVATTRSPEMLADVTARFGGGAPTSATSTVAESGTVARSPMSHPVACRSVTTTIVPGRPLSRSAAALIPARKRVPPAPGLAPSIAAVAVARSKDGRLATCARSANVTTATRLPEAALPIASFASWRAFSNWPGADMLNEVSSATTVVAPEVAKVDAKNGRAKASASSSKAATRNASSSSSRRRRRLECSTGARRSRCTAENRTRCSGSRFRRCSTIGTAAASAPRRNSGDRNAIRTRAPASTGTASTRVRGGRPSSAGGSRCLPRQARVCTGQ